MDERASNPTAEAGRLGIRTDDAGFDAGGHSVRELGLLSGLLGG
jgi:hypothetical protein